MLLIVALLSIFVIFVFVKSKVEAVEDVPVTDVPADVFDVSVEDVAVEDISVANVPVDVSIANVKNINVTEVSEKKLEALCQILSPPISSRKSSKEEVKGKKPRSKPLKTKTYTSCSSVVIIEEETEAELLARKFDEQLYGRRAAKKKSNHEDLRPVGRRPRDNKEKGDFRQDRRLKASRQKAVVESRSA